MEGFMSKLSLYDILSMLIPGGTILLVFSIALGCQLQLDSSCLEKGVAWIIIIVISYLLGLINHVFTAIFWFPFRNCPLMIQNCYERVCSNILNPKFLNEFMKKKMDYYTQVLEARYLWYIILTYIGIPLITIFITLITVNYKWVFLPFITYLLILIFHEILRHTKHLRNTEYLPIVDYYYDIYYYLEKCKFLGTVSIIEGQVAFIQNMLFPLLLFIILPNDICWIYFDTFTLKTIIGIGICCLIPTMYLEAYNNQEQSEISKRKSLSISTF